MARYEYQPLHSENGDIRIVSLLPGLFDSAVRISIRTAQFPRSIGSQAPEISTKALDEIQSSLGAGYQVYKTLNGRLIYHSKQDDDIERTTWHYPHLEASEPVNSPRDHNCCNASFEALSYAWTQDDNKLMVEVIPDSDANPVPTDLPVSQSLVEILRYLRLPDGARDLWIDAICINQDDLIEKGSQVARMHSLYQCAKRVVVWLGPASSDSAMALEHLSYLGQQVEVTCDSRLLPSPSCEETNWWRHDCSINFTIQAYESMAHLLRRPWFQRLWIVQEIQLANSKSIVQCGDRSASWYDVRKALIALRYNNTIPLYGLMDQLKAIRHLTADIQSWGVAGLIQAARSCKCSDEKDRVYAMMGLLPRSIASLITPDYTITATEVYIKGFLSIVEVTKRLTLIGSLRKHKEGSKSMPSWVPILSEGEDDSVRAGWPQASSGTATDAAHIVPGQLQVTGVIHSTIESISNVLGNDCREVSRSFIADSLQRNPNPIEDEVSDMVTSILSLGRLSNRWSGYPTLQVARTLLYEYNEVPGYSFDQWLSRTYQLLATKVLFRTHEGAFGCGPSDARPDDRVCVLLGYEYPVVLRPSPGGRYQVVGRCYVHGLMERQALLGPVPKPWRLIARESHWDHDDPQPQALYVNDQTGEETLCDARLEDLPEDWEEVAKEDDLRMPFAQHYRNKKTKQVINSDPRLSIEALRLRGAPLERIVLV